MNNKIEKLYYAPDDITGEWQLCGWGVDVIGVIESACSGICISVVNQ